jgi:hypothetical protein
MRRVWRGRCRDRTWKAFVALGDQLVSTGELVRRIWTRLNRHRPIHYHRARLAALEIAEQVAAPRANGRPWLWLPAARFKGFWKD